MSRAAVSLFLLACLVLAACGSQPTHSDPVTANPAHAVPHGSRVPAAVEMSQWKWFQALNARDQEVLRANQERVEAAAEHGMWREASVVLGEHEFEQVKMRFSEGKTPIEIRSRERTEQVGSADFFRRLDSKLREAGTGANLEISEDYRKTLDRSECHLGDAGRRACVLQLVRGKAAIQTGGVFKIGARTRTCQFAAQLQFDAFSKSGQGVKFRLPTLRVFVAPEDGTSYDGEAVCHEWARQIESL